MSVPERFAVEPVMGAAYRAFRAGAAGGYWVPALVITLVIDLLGRWVDPLTPLVAFAILLPVGALLQALLAPFLILTLLGRFQTGENAVDSARALDFVDFARMFGLYVLVFFALLIGLIFFILPGILVLSFLFFADVALIRERCGPIEAIERSVRVGSGQRIHIFILVLFLTGASLVADFGFEMLFAEYPILDIVFDTAVQVPLLLYGYIVGVVGYLSLTAGADPSEISDTFT